MADISISFMWLGKKRIPRIDSQSLCQEKRNNSNRNIPATPKQGEKSQELYTDFYAIVSLKKNDSWVTARSCCSWLLYR